VIRTPARGHEYGKNIFRAKSLNRYTGDKCRVHAAGKAKNNAFYSAFMHIVAHTEHHGSEQGFQPLRIRQNGFRLGIAIKGNGTEKNGRFSGTVTALVEYDEMVVVECMDVSTKKLEEGYLSGSFHVKLGAAAREEAGAVMGGLEIRLTLDQGDKKASGKVEVILQGTTLGTLTLDSSAKLKGEVKFPEDAVPLEEMGMPNLEIIFNRLKAAGLNDQLVDSLGQMLLFGVLG